jgi:hypothetical protein
VFISLLILKKPTNGSEFRIIPLGCIRVFV